MPTEPVSGLDGEWVDFADARIRLRSLAELDADELTDHSGRPIDLPAIVHVWQATLEIDAPDDADIGGCEIVLQDASGDTYAADPIELARADIEPYYGCLRPSDGPETGPFTVTATFVTATDRARGVRVTVPTELPRYAWLTAPD